MLAPDGCQRRRHALLDEVAGEEVDGLEIGLHGARGEVRRAEVATEARGVGVDVQGCDTWVDGQVPAHRLGVSGAGGKLTELYALQATC